MNLYREKSKLLAALTPLADDKYKAFHASLVPGLEKLLGVRVPDLKALAKTVAKTDSEDFLAAYPITSESLYEEKMIYGLVCATAKLETAVRRQYLARFLPLIDSWAVCDTVAGSMKFLKKEAAEWKAFIFTCASGGTFEKRFFAVCTMLYYNDAADIDEVLRIYQTLHGDYYVDMGVAWALATLYLTWPEKVRPLLQIGAFSNDTIYKTIGKLCDSYRVNAQDKAAFRALRTTLREKEKQAAKETNHDRP